MKKHKRAALGLRNKELTLMALPAMIAVFIFCYIPIGGIVIAFKDYNVSDGIFGSKWVGLRNFEFFFRSSDAFRVIRNTVGLNLLFIIVGMSVAIIFALMMFEISSKLLVKFYQTSMILPYFLSWVIVSYMLYALLSPRLGAINHIVERINPAFASYNWYGKPAWWPFILTIVFLWKNTGIDFIMYYAGLMDINTEFFEAAELDGATKLQQMRYISIPSITPLICMLFILKIGGIINADFGMFYQLPMNSGLLYSTTDVINTYVFRALKDVGDVGMSSAVGLFQSVVGMIMIIATNKIVNHFDADNALF